LVERYFNKNKIEWQASKAKDSALQKKKDEQKKQAEAAKKAAEA
jgi:hypothetical protein